MTNPTYIGTSQGDFSVDAKGGVTYAIPVAVPPGTGGMAPQLVLVYNSSAGDELLG